MSEQKPQQNMDYLRFLGVGLTWVVSTGVFLYLGTLIDARWGSKPVFSLAGAFIGAAAGFYYVYRQSLESIKRKDDTEA